MPKVFISYRRDESAGYAGRIHERLASVLGRGSVFMDLDDIHPGADFVKTIETGLGTCDVMLVLVGTRWLDYRNAGGGRRLDDPHDFVRLELAEALAGKIRVVPVLLNRASMPAEVDLPSDLASFARLQALELSDERWDYDVGQLLQALGVDAGGRIWLRKKVRLAAAAVLMLFALAAAVIFMRSRPALPPVQGEWQATVEYDWGATYPETLVFEIDDDHAVHGTASFLKLDRTIAEGTLTETSITFETRSEENAGSESKETRHSYRGTIRGGEIDFVMQTSGGFSVHPAVRFTARRAPTTGGSAPPSR